MSSLSVPSHARFKIIIGVDQTGAAMAGGKLAKPLPCAAVFLRDDRWTLEIFNSAGSPLKIASFNRACIELLVESRGFSLGETALAVDCVMGLPEIAWPSCRGGSAPLWNLFARAARDGEGRTGYGLKPAAAFFDRIRERASISDKPARRCEVIAKANSVFNTHPFQKNVQCGTYRIWRDLGLENLAPHQRWLRLWNFDEPLPVDALADQAWFFESYPSLFWREMLNLRTRKISELRKMIEQVFGSLIQIDSGTWEVLEADPNHADSAVLALGAWHLQSQGDLILSRRQKRDQMREAWLKKEGWILGLSQSEPISSP